MTWTAILLLGVYHGINPGMGWLFAAALGMQHQSERAVWWALLPIALGHAVAVGAVVLAAGVAQVVLPLGAIKLGVAGILVAFGIYRLFRTGHPRYGGMRVGFGRLTVWSFLMATAHGAGFMVLPFIFGMDHGGAHGHAAGATSPALQALAVLAHTATYLAVTGLIAWVVYTRVGLRLLRKSWINFDLIWAVALIVTGVFVAVT